MYCYVILCILADILSDILRSQVISCDVASFSFVRCYFVCFFFGYNEGFV